MKYRSFTFLYPPRAEKAIPDFMLPIYEEKGWEAEVKMNGTNNVVFVPPKGDLMSRQREGEEHKLWNFTQKSAAVFKELQDGKNWHVFNAELIHSKTSDSNYRDINYIHDVLVWKGVYLLGTTRRERLALLHEILDPFGGTEMDDYRIITPNTWLAKQYKKDFRKIWGEIQKDAQKADAMRRAPLKEGLVLKKPDGILNIGGEKANTSWTVKCRVSHKNYSY
jgi:hypothetical protein